MKAGRAPRDWQPIPTLLLGLIVLLLAAVCTAWWWLGTEASLRWAIERAQREQPIEVKDAHGSLRTGATFARIAWQRDGLQVEAEQVAIAWRPVFLFGGTLKFDHVNAASVRITDRRPPQQQPASPPGALPLPIQVDLDDLSVGRVEWIAASTMKAENLSGRYWYDGKSHWLRIDRLGWSGGSYRGQARLGAQAPMPVDAQLSGELSAPVPGAGRLPLQFSATVTGPVDNLAATARVIAQQDGSAATQATVTARITPWAAHPVPQARAVLDGLDLADVWSESPHTGLSGTLSAAPAERPGWQVAVDLRNARPGPWDKDLLPLNAVQAQGEWRDGSALVKSLSARLAGGTLRASGAWHPASPGAKAGWTVQGQVADIDPAALHTRLGAAPLGGAFEARQDGAGIAFTADLQGKPRAARAPGPPRVLLTLLKARGRFESGVLTLPAFEARTTDARAAGLLEYTLAQRAGGGHVTLQAPGLRAQADGTVAPASGAGTLELRAADLAQARAWIARLPGTSFADRWPALAGSADLTLAWRGGWRDPDLDARLTSRQLALAAKDSQAAGGWRVNELTATVKGRASGAAWSLRAAGRQGTRNASLDASGSAAVNLGGAAVAWRATIAALAARFGDGATPSGAWNLALQAPVEVRGAGADFDAGAGRAAITPPGAGKSAAPASLAWEPVRRRAGELRTAGRLEGIPMAWLELLSPQLAGSALSGNMVFDAQWDASLGRTLRLDASLARQRGDVTVLADSADGAGQRVAAGVRDARLVVAGRGDQLTATLKWDSERAGSADGRLVTRLSPGGPLGWQWPADAAIDANLRARLPRLGVWSLLAPPGWRLRGSLAADVRATGTRSQPQLAGTLAADDLALRSVVDGIELGGGRLRASLDGSRLHVGEFILHGAGGSGGTLSATGDIAWVGGAPQLKAVARLDRLRASIRSDRELTVSGGLEAALDGAGTTIQGKLRVDQARIVLPEEVAPRLGDDVVVRGSAEFAGTVKERQADDARERDAKRPVRVAVDIDLGDDFRVSGRGLSTRVAGTLALSAQALSQPRLSGTVRTVGGQYRAFGQRLDIERGVLRFNGVVANPGLDILAVRPNITQRVGVLVTGTAQAPFVRLYAEPDLPDAEKLAWLVTGRAAPATGAEAALVQQAALALLTSRKPGSRTFASRVGLDDLSVRRDAGAGAVVTLGKRFADNFYASYERSLSGALGTLFVFYDVSRRLTLRAQAGERTGVDLIYTFRFD